MCIMPVPDIIPNNITFYKNSNIVTLIQIKKIKDDS